MGRKLHDKLSKVEFSGEQVTEGYWQQRLRERDARSKLRQKEYADRTRGAKYSDIRSGDKVLLKQTRDSKLSPNFEPDPYVVAHKDGNAVVLQDAEGNCKMRNIAHMKKFVEPATVEIGASKGAEQPELPEQVVEPVQCDQPEPAANQSSLQPQEVLLSKSPRSSDTSRPARIRHKPAWMKDFVCN